ncbi:hypothetical protein CQY20_25950 [Mycolicibacterium agri]|uniref:Phospholipase D-like domain-containing protein n=1 Tax=Mycolicibacterium agri TaxID=36811 RepID=A0A2A7MT75_MYCAG|nr:hypothetical protein CQY20_25950 [Mycolicibacterium agri]GFG52331.1 hypothetical protein MAGR_37720 [Mycolicibacterium agri]
MITPGAALLELAAASQQYFVMCAPFVKERVVAQLLSAAPRGVKPVLYTRWRPDEVAAGVSDTEVLELLRSHEGVVYLHDRLHAKYYRNESGALIGSANLTGAALGWSPNPNIELLIASGVGAVQDIENHLAAESYMATDAIAREVEDVASLLPRQADVPEVAVTSSVGDLWIPSLRVPGDLYIAYLQGAEVLASRSASAAVTDLAVLELPAGLDRSQFRLLVGRRLRNERLFKAIDAFLEQPRRFGEVRQMIGELTGLDRSNSDDAWQTVMRWMLEFLPSRYSRTVRRHSEVITRISGHDREATQ